MSAELKKPTVARLENHFYVTSAVLSPHTRVTICRLQRSAESAFVESHKVMLYFIRAIVVFNSCYLVM